MCQVQYPVGQLSANQHYHVLQAAAERARKGQSGQVVRHKIQSNATKLVMSYCSQGSEAHSQKQHRPGRV